MSLFGSQKKYLQQINDVAKTGRQVHPAMRAVRYYILRNGGFIPCWLAWSVTWSSSRCEVPGSSSSSHSSSGSSSSGSHSGSGGPSQTSSSGWGKVRFKIFLGANIQFQIYHSYNCIYEHGLYIIELFLMWVWRRETQQPRYLQWIVLVQQHISVIILTYSSLPARC